MNLQEQLKQQIEQEAKDYANLEICDIGKIDIPALVNQWEQTREDYIAGATAYATRAITAEAANERLRKALRDFATRLNEHCTKQGIYSAGIHKIHDDMLEALTPKPTTNE